MRFWSILLADTNLSACRVGFNTWAMRGGCVEREVEVATTDLPKLRIARILAMLQDP